MRQRKGRVGLVQGGEWSDRGRGGWGWCREGSGQTEEGEGGVGVWRGVVRQRKGRVGLV